jgi:hypothetical protein
MMINCMNDPGPILDTRAGSPTFGQMITDPNFNPLFSDFCYEDPFMPNDVDYLDTPVVPVAAFAEGYNPPDCAFPDATPAILRVDGDGPGPYVSVGGHTITITALGTQPVSNPVYSGPSATTSPYNQKFINRHYGFGTQCTAPMSTSATCNTRSSVTIGWRDHDDQFLDRWDDCRYRTHDGSRLRYNADGNLRRERSALRRTCHHRRKRQTVNRRSHSYRWR